jgi:hypothetical protein
MKFAGFAYHLYHQENSREMLPANQAIVDAASQGKTTRCNNGIDKYLSSIFVEKVSSLK